MSKNRLKAVFGVLGVLVLGCLYHLYTLVGEAGDTWPAENEPGTLTNQLNQLDEEVRRLRMEVAKIPAAEERLKAVNEEYELASRVLPRESSPDQLIAAIHTKAQQSGVIPTSLSPSVAKGGPQPQGGRGQGSNAFETWRFTLNLTGSYDQLATFINRMEEFDSPDAARTGSEKRFFEVRDITITSEENGLANLTPEGAGKPVEHKCVVVMQTYRYTGE